MRPLFLPIPVLFLLAAASSQEPAKPKPARANAAGIYRLALAELGQRFEVSADDILALPPNGGHGPADWRFQGTDWEEAIDRSATARTLFAQAAAVPHCDFGPGQEPGFAGYDAPAIQLLQIAQLVAAHGWRQLPATPVQAAIDARSLLRHARHVKHQPTSQSSPYGHVIETMGLVLLRETIQAANADGKARTDCQAALLEHTARRPGLAILTDNCEAEVARLLDVTLGNLTVAPDQPDDPTQRAMRAHAAAISAKTRATIRDALAPLRRAELAAISDIKDAQQQFAERLRQGATQQDIERKIETLTREQIVDVLSRNLAGLLMPNVGAMAEGEVEAQALLQQCRELLATGSTDK